MPELNCHERASLFSYLGPNKRQRYIPEAVGDEAASCRAVVGCVDASGTFNQRSAEPVAPSTRVGGCPIADVNEQDFRASIDTNPLAVVLSPTKTNDVPALYADKADIASTTYIERRSIIATSVSIEWLGRLGLSPSLIYLSQLRLPGRAASRSGLRDGCTTRRSGDWCACITWTKDSEPRMSVECGDVAIRGSVIGARMRRAAI